MARVTVEKSQETKVGLLDAARQVLEDEGYAGLSIRRVAAQAEAPMSQIRYHFGSKEGMVLALFEHLNAQLLDRQATLFTDTSLSLSAKWVLACGYLDDDLESGYVSVLHELLAAGWTNPEIGAAVRTGLQEWGAMLEDVARQASSAGAPLSPLDADDLAVLAATAFIGAESFLLLGMEETGLPVRRALRRVGVLIGEWESSLVCAGTK